MEFPLYVANHVSPPMLQAHLSVDDTYFRRDTWRRALALNVRVWAAHSTQWTSNRSTRLSSNRFSNGKWVIGLRHIYVYYIYVCVCMYIYIFICIYIYIHMYIHLPISFDTYIAEFLWSMRISMIYWQISATRQYWIYTRILMPSLLNEIK